MPFEHVTEAFFDETMNINLKGAFFTVQKALPLMPNGSAIVLNASINAHTGMPNTTVYGATKAAVVNLAKTLSNDLLGRGVRVNSISPGPITTSIISRMGLSQDQERQTKEWIQSQVPLKRFGTADEVAALVLFLTASESAYIVGTDVIIDGGMVSL